MTAFHTMTYTTILFASTTLRMSSTKIIVIGLLFQLAAMFGSSLAPRLQSRLGFSNIQVLTCVVILVQAIPLYISAGIFLPFGGLRTEIEVYVMVTGFGMVCALCRGMLSNQLYGPFSSYSRAVYADLIPPVRRRHLV
jgi:UMF1 family MFS transporter